MIMTLTAPFFVRKNSNICINIDDSLRERLDREHILHINIQGLTGKTLILETFFSLHITGFWLCACASIGCLMRRLTNL